MTQSNEIKNLLTALVEVQSELPTMPKDSQAYGYKYADLDLITQTIKPILKKHKVGYMQSVGSDGNGAHILTTRIFDANGEYIEDTAILPVISGVKNNAAQTLGMSITYMRRYALCAMFGITSDEDTDANPQGNPPQQPHAAQKAKDAPAPAKPQLKGGDATPEEKKRIQELLDAKYSNGFCIFTYAEKLDYSKLRETEMTAAELIAHIEAELFKRDPSRTAKTPAKSELPLDIY